MIIHHKVPHNHPILSPQPNPCSQTINHLCAPSSFRSNIVCPWSELLPESSTRSKTLSRNGFWFLLEGNLIKQCCRLVLNRRHPQRKLRAVYEPLPVPEGRSQTKIKMFGQSERRLGGLVILANVLTSHVVWQSSSLLQHKSCQSDARGSVREREMHFLNRLWSMHADFFSLKEMSAPVCDV